MIAAAAYSRPRRPAALPDGKGAAVLGASPTPALSAGGGKPILDGDDDISPAILGGAKGAQVYPNLAASLDGVAAASGEGAGLTAIADAAVDSPPSDDASSTAVSVYAAGDISDAKSFLERHGVSVDYFGDTWLEANVPARLLGALSERADVIRVEKIIPAVSDRAPSPSASPTPEPCRYNLGTLDARSGIAGSETRSGTWSVTACPSSRKHRYARFYTFTLNAQSTVTLDLATPDATETTEKVAPEMFLRVGQNTLGEYIDRDWGRPKHRDPSERDANIYKGLYAGTYTIEAATRHREKTGSFTLTVAYAADRVHCEPIELGSLSTASLTKSVSAEWPANCFSGARAGQAAYYSFDLPQAAVVEINLSSSVAGADPFLYVRSGARTFGASVASDDDGGTGNAAFIRRALAAGSYTVEAASQSPTARGWYSLSIDIPAGCISNLGTLAADREIEGSWTSDCESSTRAGSYARYYSFSLSSPAFVEVELESSAESDDAAKSPRHVYTYPVLRAGAGARTGPAIGLRQDDPSATSLTPVDGAAKGYDDSLWRKASMVSRLLAAGDYTVEAATMFPRRVGDFTLTLSPTFATPCAAAPLTLTDGAEISPADQSWTSGCDSARIIGARAKHYTFTLAAPKTVKIELDSSDAYTRLYLTRGASAAGTEFIDDDPPAARAGAQPRGRRIEFSRWDIALGALPTRDSRIERILGAGNVYYRSRRRQDERRDGRVHAQGRVRGDNAAGGRTPPASASKTSARFRRRPTQAIRGSGRPASIGDPKSTTPTRSRWRRPPSSTWLCSRISCFRRPARWSRRTRRDSIPARMRSRSARCICTGSSTATSRARTAGGIWDPRMITAPRFATPPRSKPGRIWYPRCPVPLTGPAASVFGCAPPSRRRLARRPRLES